MTPVELLAERARLVAAAPPGDVPSPCISLCRMDPAGELCEGCWRALDEIAAWGRMDDEGRREVWRRIEMRLGDAAPGRKEIRP